MNVSRKLFNKLQEIHCDKDFVIGVMSNAKMSKIVKQSLILSKTKARFLLKILSFYRYICTTRG